MNIFARFWSGTQPGKGLKAFSAFACLSLAILVASCSNRNSCRILPVGDSITVGYLDNSTWQVPFKFGYRSVLFGMLKDANVPVRFVGHSPEPWDGSFYFPKNEPALDLRRFGQDHHEAYGGKGTEFVRQHIGEWVTKNKPDFVLLMIGINDIPPGSTNPPAAAETNLREIVQAIVNLRPQTHVILAQTIPYTEPTPALVEFNRFIREELAPEFASQGARVSAVDQFANFISKPGDLNGEASLYSNGLNHPNAEGYRRMAQTWFDEIQRLRSGVSK